MTSQGNKTNRAPVERGSEIHEEIHVLFSWQFFKASHSAWSWLWSRAQERLLRQPSRSGALLCGVTHVLTQFFPSAWHLWPLLQILWLLVTRPEALVIFLFEKEEKKNPQSWGNPQGKICLGGRDLWKFWRKVLTVRDVHALCSSKHEEKKKKAKNLGISNKFWDNSYMIERFYLLG